MKKDLEICRSASLSSVGRKFDRYFMNSKSSSLEKVSAMIRKVKSQHALTLPKLKTEQTQKSDGTLSEQSKYKGKLYQLGSQAEKQRQMKQRIKTQIQALKYNALKSKKLVLGNHKRLIISAKETMQYEESGVKIIEHWKDLKKAVPQAGYVYIDCRIGPPIKNSPERQVTLSSDRVLITEPYSQQIYSIDQYEQILKRQQSIWNITLFKHFQVAKAFRQWRIISEIRQMSNKINLFQGRANSLYSQVYTQLINLLQKVRKLKFVGSSSQRSITMPEYPDYLFTCSSSLLEEIHYYTFVGCVDVIFKPIKDHITQVKAREEEKKKAKSMNRPVKKLLIIRQKKEEEVVQFSYLKSSDFRQQFIKFAQVIKKCLYIYTKYYVEWIDELLLDLITKIERTLSLWSDEKRKFNKIMGQILSEQQKKYAYYNPELTECGITLITYSFEMQEDKKISFQANQDDLVSLFKQYSDYLVNNLTFFKLVECYAKRRHKILPEELSKKRSEHADLQILEQIMKNNDWYCCSQILQKLNIKNQFAIRLKNAFHTNFAQIHTVINMYNQIISDFYNTIDNQSENQVLTSTFEYLQTMRVRLIYLPVNVNVGMFALNFTSIHQYLQLQVAYRQTQIYQNVPSDFKQLFSEVRQFMDQSYCQIKNTIWTVEGLLLSNSAYERYQQYRINQLHEDLAKFKSYLEVIGAKCNEHYQPSFLMFMHVKQMRDKLEIKNQIFTQSIPNKLRSFRNDIEKMREDIWKGIFKEQTALISICREAISLPDKLTALTAIRTHLDQHKRNMDQLETIGRLQMEYFIEQDLTVNTHAYLKMNHDINLLIEFTQKYLLFASSIELLLPNKITDVQTDDLLQILKANVSEIKQVYLLLIVYETILKNIIQKYDEWRHFLETIAEIASLSEEEINSVKLLKQAKFHNKSSITLAECYRLNVQTIYNQIHQIKQRKIKIAELNSLLIDLDYLQERPPFQITVQQIKTVSRISKQENTNTNLGSTEKAELEQKAQRHPSEKTKYEFQNYTNIYKSLQQFQNELKMLKSSPYLSDYKMELTLRTDQLDKAVGLLDIVTESRKQYNEIMKVEMFENNQIGVHERCSDQSKWLMSEEVVQLLADYRRQRQQIRECWIKAINGLGRKSILELLAAYQQIDGALKVLNKKMSTLCEWVENLVKKKRQQVYLLNLVDSSEVLSVIQSPSHYFQLFYPIKSIIKPEFNIQITTIYDEKIVLKKVENQKDTLIEINTLQTKINDQIRKLLALHRGEYPTDHLVDYLVEEVLLQVVYIIDHLYFSSHYLAPDKTAAFIIKGLETQIKQLCRNGLKVKFDHAKITYSLALFDQMVASRIEWRNRVDHHSERPLWYRNILVLQMYENMLVLRNFNTIILSQFRLIDNRFLSCPFPFAEKALVKICNAMKFEQSIVVRQTELVSTIAARSLSVYYKVEISPANVESILFACHSIYPLFVVATLTDIQEGLRFVFEQLNKIERITSINRVSKEERLLPALFIYCQAATTVELSETLKLRFRSVAAIDPCPQVLLCSRMLTFDFLIERSLFLNMVYLLRSYILLSKERNNYYVSFAELIKICDKIIKRMSRVTVDATDRELLTTHLHDYFSSIPDSQMRPFQFDKFLDAFINKKQRVDYERSSIYDIAQNITTTTYKDLSFPEEASVAYRLREYNTMKKSFQKFVENLITQKYETTFVNHLTEVFQLAFNLDNRPLAVIGNHQSGKSHLFVLYFKYLAETLGRYRLNCRFCNVQTLNIVLGKVNQNDPIIESFITDSDHKDISWIVFEGFIFEHNVSLLDHIFSRIGPPVKIKAPLHSNGQISNCDLYRCREKYCQEIKNLHSKYIGFQLTDLKGVSPSYICDMNKIYISEGDLSTTTYYFGVISNLFREFVDRTEEAYPKMAEAFNQLYSYLSELLDEILVYKVKLLDWVISVNHKIGIERTMNYFLSFYQTEGRQKLCSLFSDDDYSQKLRKLITYCLFVTFSNFVQENSIGLLSKTIKGVYYKLSPDQSRDHFLNKICYFTSQQLSYCQLETLRQKQKTQNKQMLLMNMIQTPEIAFLERRYLRQLVAMQVPIMVVGAKESGKTSMIRIYLQKYCHNAISISAAHTQAIFKEFHLQISNLGNLGMDQKRTSIKQSIQIQDLYKRTDYVVYVEDVSMQQSLTEIQKYIRYIKTYGVCIDGSHFKKAPVVAPLFERRSLTGKMQSEIWDMYVINFHIKKEYFDQVFSVYIKNTIDSHLRARSKKPIALQNILKSSQKYIQLIKFCSQNFKRGHKTWTYDYGISTLKFTLQNFINRYNYDEIVTEQLLLCRMNAAIYISIRNRLQELREVDKVDDRMASILDSAQFLAMEQYQQKETRLMCCMIEEQNPNNGKIKNVILNNQLQSFGPKLAAALRTAECILINKVNIPFNRSVASILVQILKLQTRQILYCENESKFLSQIEKLSQLSFNKKSIAYYYVSLQELINNPGIIKYITNFLKPSQGIKREEIYHQYKFILEYSTQHYESIAEYLKVNILSLSHVLHYREQTHLDLNDIASKLIEEKNFNGTTFTVRMDEAIKITTKIFEDLQNFQPPKYLSKYLFSKLSYSHLLMQVLQNYNHLQRRLETKRSALQISLSELTYMFKEYKERKTVYKQLLLQQSALQSQLAIDRADQHKKFQEFNNKKNQNLKEDIHKNEFEIVRLQKQKEKFISSQKIWLKIYRNTQNSISRTEFAELKYMFLTNYFVEKDLFEAIAYVLGEPTDILSVKKCFSDINIMAKIKQLSIPDLPLQRLQDLQTRILVLDAKEKLGCGKNILEWMKVGCKLGIHRIQRSEVTTNLQTHIKQLEEQNQLIRDMNKIDEIENSLHSLEKRIEQKSAELNIVQIKVKSIGSELQDVKKQFQKLLQFEGYCLQELQKLQEHSQKILNFCIHNAIQFNLGEVMNGEPQKKFREVANAKLRKTFGNLVSHDDSEYFQILGNNADDRDQQKWLIKPKYYLSNSKKKLIQEANNFLLQHNQPLAVIDRRYALLQDTVKNRALSLRLCDMMKGKTEKQYQKYNLIIIEMDSWMFSLRLSNNEYETARKYRVFKYKHIRLVLPAQTPIIFVVNNFGGEQFMNNYKVIDLEYSFEDYYEIIHNIVIKKREKDEQTEDLNDKRAKVEKCLMNIVDFLCKKTQSINLKSTGLIKVLTRRVQQFYCQKSSQKVNSYAPTPDQKQAKADDKLCRMVAKVIELMLVYFPSEQHTSFFFRDLLNTSIDYVQMSGKKDNEEIIYLIMQLLTEGFKDKFPFIYFYYVKIFAVEEGIATIIESQNLISIIEPREQIADCFKDSEKDLSSFFKYLPYRNMDLEKVYNKIVKFKLKSQEQISMAIDQQTALSPFNRLILKRALTPKHFEIQIGKIIVEFQDRITLKNKMFLRRFVVKQKLFCVCDASYWISKLKSTDQFKIVQLSKLTQTNLVSEKVENWAVFDDMEDGQPRNDMLSELMRLNSSKVSTLLFSKQYLREDFREQFKFLPFQHLLNIFEIKELTKVSRSKYSNVFKKVIYFKTEMLKRKPFNQRIAFSFLFEKVREQAMNRQNFSLEEIVYNFEWNFFLWDAAFEANHQKLHFILNRIDQNAASINEFVADGQLQDRVSAIVVKSKNMSADQTEICKLAHQLRDSSSKLQSKQKSRVTPGSKDDIFYRQFDFKRTRLLKQIQTIKKISELQTGKTELNWEMIIEVKNLLASFNYHVFGRTLVKVMNWRRMEQYREVVDISQLESEFHIHLLFEHSLFAYYEMENLQLEDLKERYKRKDNGDLATPTETSNRSFTIINRQKSHDLIPSNRQNLQGRRVSVQQNGSEHEKAQARDMRCSFKSLIAVKESPHKGRKLSIVKVGHLADSGPKLNEEELIEKFCKNAIFIVDNRVIVLRKLNLREQKHIVACNQRTLHLPGNLWSLRIVDLQLVVSLIAGERNKGRRFSKIIN